jgi:hypothetical protein
MLLKISGADIDLHDNSDKSVAASWAWGDIDEFFPGEESDDPEEMDLFHCMVGGKEYIFECDNAEDICASMEKFQNEFIAKKKKIALAVAAMSKHQKDRIAAIFQCIDVDAGGEVSLKECGIMLRILGYDPKSASTIANRMDTANDGTICYADFLEAVVERQDPAAGNMTVILLYSP